MERFVCTVRFGEEFKVGEDIIKKLGIERPEQIHESTEAIYNIAIESEYKGWIILPLCSTIAAESLGADVRLSIDGARIKEERYKSKEEINSLFDKNMDKDCKRLAVMMDVLKRLSSEGKHVIYGVEGPFTLLNSLMPMSKMFLTMRKDKEGKLLSNARKWALEYMTMAIENGAEVISYADPIANIDIIGEKMFKEIYLPLCRDIIETIKEKYPDTAIHICGKLTQSIIDTDCCEITRRLYDDKSSYGEVIREYVDDDEKELIGHYCLNRLDSNRNYIEIISWRKNQEV
ncbi:uroporphyrinogen decarboxylase family protein [Clostridioides difficile]|uniref:uroporphyrinogen decarboxylase family protein n=1 Tax=Clostridioides difficile TaxID=1496 RepID=UPI000825CC54|nr:uroporphyrinogen decarboxylase family protein [Clostridioides difficile]MDO0136282.1 hypothetical protein [Clostridioides difficile]MDX5649349.1 uroporphyrinogen decarboxylase family protein [Clostridioides difficile]HBG7259465.1 hypothetical protein [Clostridioides difficile]HBY2627063.1 hypothetical protein [Clostridioides difficile]HBY3615737.1 hypothetical protein [Clostridioides difficile]